MLLQCQWPVGGDDVAGGARPPFVRLIRGDVVGEEPIGDTVVPVVDEPDERRRGGLERLVRRGGDGWHEAVVVEHLEHPSCEQPHRGVGHVDAVYGIGGSC